MSPCLIREQLPVLLVGQREKEASSDGLDFATLSCCPCDLFVWTSNTALKSCTRFPSPLTVVALGKQLLILHGVARERTNHKKRNYVF